jgi:hypothetical protein
MVVILSVFSATDQWILQYLLYDFTKRSIVYNIPQQSMWSNF